MSDATTPGTVPEALAEPTVRVRAVFMIGLALANLGIMLAFFTPILNLLPRLSEEIAGSDGKEAALAVVTHWPARCRTARHRASGAAGHGCWGGHSSDSSDCS